MSVPDRGTRAGFLAFVAALLLAGGAWAAEPADAPEPEAPAADAGVRAQAIDRLVNRYLEMYGKHLESRDWMARAMAVIGLARIDDPRITKKLFEVLEADKLPLVRVYAWEGLHSRLGSLQEAQRARWIRAGKKLLGQGHLRGDLRVGLVRAMAPAGPTDENRQLFRYLFQKTNSMDSSDIRTLRALGDVLAAWRDRTLIDALIGVMGRLDCVFRAEYVLRSLPWAPGRRAESFASKGSDVLLQEVETLWRKAFGGAGEDAFQPVPAEPYNGPSLVLPRAETITDPADRKWRRDLELTRFTLSHLDVTLLVDSTGSMMPVIRWIQRDVTKLMRAFYLISYEPRIGIVFYRDHGDAYVVKPFPLTSKADVLSRAIRKIEAKGGGDEPEAVFDAVRAALKQTWSSGHYARRIVVLVGDAPPHQDSMADLEKLVTAAAKNHFQFFCLKVRGKYTAASLTHFDQIAKWGNGEAIWAEFHQDQFPDIEYPDLVERSKRPRTARTWNAQQALAGVAEPTPRDDPCRQLVREIVRTAIPELYRYKTEPFVDTLLEYLEQYVPERRQTFGPVEEEPEHHDGPRRRRDEKPFDPQAR